MNEKDIIIETQPNIHDNGICYKLPNGNKAWIGKYDRDFFEQLQKLPYQTKINMMELSENEMLSYIEEKKKSANDLLINLLKDKWYFRDTGDRLIFTDDMIEGVPYSLEYIKRRTRSKNPFPLPIINKIIDFFTGRNSEVYVKFRN